MALIITGCTNNSTDEPTTTEPIATTGQTSAIVKGEGENAFVFIAVDLDGNSTHYMIKTDKETVGEALVNEKLISGENGQYGLMVDTVNGQKYDYNADGAYWAFYVNGEYATSGVDTTPIKDGEVYSFVATKA